MDTNRRLTPIAVAIALLLGTLAIYGCSYVMTSVRVAGGWEDGKVRDLRYFSAKWQCALFWPAAHAEAIVRGVRLYVFHHDEGSGEVLFSRHP